MNHLIIEGKTPLKGSVYIPGAKNSITKLLVASLISDKPCTFYNVPNIEDVSITLDLCQQLGMKLEWNKQERTLHCQTKHLQTTYIPQRFSGSNRVPILLIGALLGRTSEEIIVPTLGGCNIGERPVNFHIQALQELGATIEYRKMKKEGAYLAHAHHGLVGATISLPYPSVGATENALLAAVKAKGTTCIRNAAVEPEVLDLIAFLQKMGALVLLSGDREITIEGITTFHEVEHTVIADRIVAASYAMAAISTQGDIFVENAQQQELGTLLSILRKVGGGFEIKDKGIRFFYHQATQGGSVVETNVFPGFSTDWQQPFVVMMSQAQGYTVIHETVYENRFGYTKTLQKMGAHLQLFSQCLSPNACRFGGKSYPHSLIVQGPSHLPGMDIHIPDLRAGFSYIMAALIAEGNSQITGLPYLYRGYEYLVDNLKNLGANIQEVQSSSQDVAKSLDQHIDHLSLKEKKVQASS